LRTVLTLLVLACTVPLGVFGGVLIWSFWQEQHDNIDRQSVDTARAIMIAVDEQTRSTQVALNVLDASLTDDEIIGPPFVDLARRVMSRQIGWQSVWLADPSGILVAGTDGTPGADAPGIIGTHWVERLVAAGRPIVTDVAEDHPRHQFFVVVAVPVMRNGQVLYALGVRVNASTYSDVLRRQNAPADGVVTLLDTSRHIVARTRNEDAYVGGLPSPNFLQTSKTITEGSWRETLLEGTAAFASLSRSPRSDWVVGIGLPSAPLESLIRKSLWILVALWLGVIVIGAAAAVVLGRHIVSTLALAASNAHALARGDHVQPAASYIREMQDLSSGLLDASAILDQRHAERDRAERDRELALTAEQAARAASQQHEARLAVTLNSIGDAVITTDPDGLVTMLNPVAQALTGWTDAAAVGTPITQVFDIVNEVTRKAAENPVAKVFREGRIVGLANHTVLRARHGREVPIEDSASPIRDAAGTLLGVVLVFRDVTEQREAERQRVAMLQQEQTARKQAEALNRSKDEFVATVSHELRTPLNAIYGWVRLLRGGTLDEAARARAIEVIERNTRVQTQLVDDLLDMSRIITGNLRLESRRFDLQPVVEAAVEAVRPSTEARHLTLDLRTQPGGVQVHGDPDRLQQVVWNLLTNSIKFTPKDGRIDVSLDVEGSDAVIRVRDTGIGIEPDVLPYIFDRFRQGVSSDSRAHTGLGIGLALVQHLVGMHGGSVEASSSGKDQGAVFTIKLPALGGSAVAGSFSGTARDAQTLSTRPLGDLKVLVVDDEADARDLASVVLREAGATVVEAGSVKDAIAALDGFSPDAIVTDIAMPHGTGYDLLTQVRAASPPLAAPVLALTAYSHIEDRERALNAGFTAHLGKPVEPQALVHAVAAAVGRR
jgi:PAS domain S-box-containing protein